MGGRGVGGRGMTYRPPLSVVLKRSWPVTLIGVLLILGGDVLVGDFVRKAGEVFGLNPWVVNWLFGQAGAVHVPEAVEAIGGSFGWVDWLDGQVGVRCASGFFIHLAP